MGFAVNKIRHYLSRLTLNFYIFNLLLELPDFWAAHGRLPCSPSRPDASYHDFIFDKMIRNRWNCLHECCVDKELAKIVAKGLCPEVNVPATIDIVRITDALTFDNFKASLSIHLGKRLVANSSARA